MKWLMVFVLVVAVNVLVLSYDLCLLLSGLETITRWTVNVFPAAACLFVGWQLLGAVALWKHFQTYLRDGD